ncbi:MAG: hypothetical protein IT506_00530 [Aquabacterium sp.]|jgi:hypothetical protein|nr:hypothetical protein [Aquabacterium sp.]
MTAKAPSRFAAWQEAKQVRRETIIDDYLGFLAKTRVKVRNPTDLADLVAKHISEVEGEPCNKATLLRNARYKAKILTYQARSLVPGAKALNPRAVTDPTAKVLITSAQLESGNLKRELERLNIYVTSLEEQVDQLQRQGRQLPGPPDSAGSGAPLSDHEFRFVRTCQALRSLLSHLNMVVQVDTSTQRILDMSKRRDNIIVDKEVAGPFFEWLASQGGLELKASKQAGGGSKA